MENILRARVYESVEEGANLLGYNLKIDRIQGAKS